MWAAPVVTRDRKSTRLNSSHSQISYAVFCLKKKNISDIEGVVDGCIQRAADAGTSDSGTGGQPDLIGIRKLAHRQDQHASVIFFFFSDAPTTEIYTLSLHDALPISKCSSAHRAACSSPDSEICSPNISPASRSEEHTSELQSQSNLVCRLLLEK